MMVLSFRQTRLGKRCSFDLSRVSLVNPFRAVLGRAYRGLTGGFLLLQNFSVAISVSPHVCFILVLILNRTTKCPRNQGRTKGEGWSTAN